MQGIRRFYSVVVDDARSIAFDGDTSLLRGFIEHKGGHRASWSILGAKPKERRYSCHIHLNISVDATTPPRPRAPTVDSYQKKRDTCNVLMLSLIHI